MGRYFALELVDLRIEFVYSGKASRFIIIFSKSPYDSQDSFFSC